MQKVAIPGSQTPQFGHFLLAIFSPNKKNILSSKIRYLNII
jgi:hypothetical protein